MRLLTLSVASMALTVFLAASGMAQGSDGHLRTGDSIRSILTHPAFKGFARLILPWDDRAYDEGLRLEAIGSLLPYHTNVDPAGVVTALNRMIDDAGQGRTIFYDIHTEAERRADPTKAHTGLFFLRGKPGAPFAIVSPGGGFSYVGSVHEGFPYATEISTKGYNAFVLKYRVGQGSAVATEDLARAIAFVFRNAEMLGVGTDGYSLWGSSAGARMAAAIGSHGPLRFGVGDLPKPAAVVMLYTGHSEVAAKEPPTFVAVGERDGIAPPSAMERRVTALRGVGTEVEYRKYPGLGHGFGLGTGTKAEGWVDDAIRFWARFTTSGN